MIGFNAENYRRSNPEEFSRVPDTWFKVPFHEGALKPVAAEAIVVSCYGETVSFKNGDSRPVVRVDLGMAINGKPARVPVTMWDENTSVSPEARTWRDRKSRELMDFEFFAHDYAGDAMSETVEGAGRDGTTRYYYKNITGMKVSVIVGTAYGNDKYPKNKALFFNDRHQSATDLATLDDSKGGDFQKAMESALNAWNKWCDKYPQPEAVSETAGGTQDYGPVPAFGSTASDALDDDIPF